MEKIKDFLKRNDIKLAANAKAKKLIEGNAEEAQIAVAMQTTKAYKENAELRKLCEDAISAAGKKQAEQAKKEERHSSSTRSGERERCW